MRFLSLLAFLSLAFGLLTLSACDFPGCEDCGPAVPAFQGNAVEMSASVDQAVYDSTFTLRISAVPLFTGKGRIALLPNTRDQIVYLDDPVVDTLAFREESVSSVTFSADQRAFQNYRLQLAEQDVNLPMTFIGVVIMDSVLVNGTYYAVNSEEARQVTEETVFNQASAQLGLEGAQ